LLPYFFLLKDLVFSLQYFYIHFMVSHKTPQRVSKSCRLIVLYEEVGNPGKTITDQQRIKQIDKIKGHKKPYVKINSYRSANKMKKLCVLVAVLAYVIRIKILKASKSFHCSPKMDLNQTAINQNRYQKSRLGSVINPSMICSPLHNHIMRLNLNLFLIKDQGDVAL